MPETKMSLLDKRIAQFFESSTELLTGIHARNNGTSNKKRKPNKHISIPEAEIERFDPDADLYDEEAFGL